MKECFLVLILITVIVGGAFAQSESNISMGVGGLFTSDFGGGAEASVSGFGTISDFKTPYAGGGGFVFLDAYYLELSISFFSVSGTWDDKEYITGTSAKYKVSSTGMDVGFWGKYPIVINNQFTLFPILGINYRAFHSVKIDGEKNNAPDDISAIWFKLGAGLDFSFTKKIFLRAGFLYGIRIKNQLEDDLVDMYTSFGIANRIRVDAESLLGHGLDVKLAIGYKL
jgi:hypothetical protein